MKKTLLFPILALILALGLALPMAVGAVNGTHTAYLYAGQDTPVGYVDVTDNGSHLTVHLTTTDDWYLVETHVAVSDNEDAVPQKNGNPIPGKFAFKHYLDTPDDEDEFTIALADVFDSVIPYNVVVAVHAEVLQKHEMTVVSRAGVTAYGPLEEYAAVDNSTAWDTASSAVAAWKHPSWPMISGSTAIWISTSEYVETPYDATSWRKFSDNVTLPDDACYISGNVTATADNAEELYLNGVLVYSDGEVQGAYTDNSEWNTILTNEISPVVGLNTIDFIVRNYSGTNSQTGNPTGLIYEVEVSYFSDEETAWAGTEVGQLPFSGRNWATFFTYALD